MKKIINELFSQFQTKAVCSRIKKNHPKLYTQINTLTAPDFRTKLFMFSHDMESVPLCNECGKKEVKLISYYAGFREFCSVKCQRAFTSKLIPESVQQYNKEHNTNFTNVSQLPSVIEKRNKTLIEKFGSIMPMNDHPEIKAKAEKTSMEKYGVSTAAHAPEVQAKAQESRRNRSNEKKKKTLEKYKSTMLKKYGFENPMQVEDFFEKAKDTRIEKYGVEYCLQNPEISKRQSLTCKKTFKEKYGVEHLSSIPEIAEKMNNPFYNKTYIWETGESVTVQGYEPIVLRELESNGYKFIDVLTNKKDMPELYYEFEGKLRRYYPDIYIPNENLIIEVKSDWTLKKYWDKNQAKFQAVKDAGYKFRLEVR